MFYVFFNLQINVFNIYGSNVDCIQFVICMKKDVAGSRGQWLLSSQIWNQSLAQLHPSFGLRFPQFLTQVFPLHFGLLSPLRRKFS